jgi:hypothetical protein
LSIRDVHNLTFSNSTGDSFYGREDGCFYSLALEELVVFLPHVLVSSCKEEMIIMKNLII